ncbi:uncharacterized protein LOC119357069 isoform X1 [Triticum dicoccoides]|uniref:uncharacterized protein LOC119357069 isoform X1 n=1 Tax=Triticum dicoccoides TaxID=85692 RepID=UPI00188DEB27|nr:uncharacterized protein LOC119357069 isoform X1 [Triticum dicoccoides]
MFLTDKYHALLPLHSAPATRGPRKAAVTSRFDAALAARLGGLLPLPASPLAALARLADLLAATLADAVPALAAVPGDGKKDAVAVAAHVDAGVALLDACNAIAARVDRLRRRRLLSRLALHLVSSTPPSPSSLSRARAALADRDGRGAGGTPSSALPALPSIPFVDPPRGGRGQQLTAAARVVLAVNAVSSLAATAAATILGGTSSTNRDSTFPQVSGDLPWAESFNAVSSQLSALAKSGTSNEIHAADEAVGKLAAVLECAAPEEAALRAATQEVEKRTEELAARLERVSDAVNGVFRAALRLRNAELGSFMAAGPAGKAPRSKK